MNVETPVARQKTVCIIPPKVDRRRKLSGGEKSNSVWLPIAGYRPGRKNS